MEPLSESMKEYIRERNSVDVTLYRELTSCRTFHFPNRSIVDHPEQANATFSTAGAVAKHHMPPSVDPPPVITEDTPSLNDLPTCVLNDAHKWMDEGKKIDEIVLLHMRKAGGTTLRHYLSRVARRFRIEFKAYEGNPTPDILTEESQDNVTRLYVTHLRHPVTRVVSHYLYENRWNCTNLPETITEPYDFSSNYTKKSLSEYLDTPGTPRSNFLWGCNHDCYARWSTGVFTDEQLASEKDLLGRARKTLSAYNLIIVTDWLKNPDYIKSIETLFGGVKGMHASVPMYCGAKVQHANDLFPLEVPPEMYYRIHEMNKIDLQLYDEFTSCESVRFPNRSLTFA